MHALDPDDAVVPVFAEGLYGGGLRHLGTGIFLDFWSQPFLLTAAHVTDSIEHSNLWVPAHDGIYPIQGYVSFVDLLPGQRRSDDHVDVAYYRLDRRFADGMLKFFKPWPQARCELITDSLSLGVCSVYGLPASRFKRNRDVYSSETATCRGVAAGAAQYEQEALSAESSIIVHFHKKRAVSRETGQRINPIHSRGMSGGGIFAWPTGSELSNDWSLPKLVGIFHTYKESKGLMIGTSLPSVAAAIQLGQKKRFGGVQ
ncbi:MAG: hypothetical protein KC588_15385 [Nitrospira sp.]|nr:hypothetical protein [Nitrospira sp.]